MPDIFNQMFLIFISLENLKKNLNQQLIAILIIFNTFNTLTQTFVLLKLDKNLLSNTTTKKII